MNDELKSRQELIDELNLLRRQLRERNMSEAVLSESEESFARVFHHSPVMTIIVSLTDQRIVETNQRFLELLGLSREEAIGRTAEELGLQKEIGQDSFAVCLDDLAEKDYMPFSEYTMRTKDGESIVFLQTVSLITIDNEICRIVIMQDMTKERQALIEQARAQECFMKFFENCPTAMIVFWAETRQIIDLNPAFERLYKCSKDETIGKVWEEAGIYATSVPEVESLRSDLINMGNARQELDLRLSDGSQIRIISSVTRLAGEPEQALASIIDITDLRRMEAELAHLDRLHLVGELAASISHEIRNPMTSVRGFLQMLGNKTEYQSDTAYFDLMIEELDRANAIITEYLGMARDKLVHLQPQSLDMIICALLPMLRSDANLREIDIRLDLNNPQEIMADKYEMRQLIINIVHNGLEAMNQSGTMTIGTYQEDRDTILYIKDEGPGIPDEILDKMDRPFFTTKEKGTGLGLSICNSIVARHSGKLDIITGPTGTTFLVRMPVAAIRADNT